MKRGGGEVLAMPKEWWGTTSFGVIFTQCLEVLAILKGGRKKFPLFKGGGGRNFLRHAIFFLFHRLKLNNKRTTIVRVFYIYYLQ